jgi:hypothetical protein
MNEKDLFIKVPVELLPLPLPRTLLVLYGRILLHAADGKGKCFTTHSKLAEEIGVSLRQINYHVQTLKRLRLIESTRGRHHDPNSYRALKPDVQWIAHQIRNGLHISDMQPIAHRKEPIGVLKEVLKEGTHPPYPPAATEAEAGSQNRRLRNWRCAWRARSNFARTPERCRDRPVSGIHRRLPSRRKTAERPRR